MIACAPLEPEPVRRPRRRGARPGLAGRAVAALLAGWLAPACAGSGNLVAPPEEFPGFPHQANVGPVWVEGVFFSNHDQALGTDLTRRGLLPVALRAGIRGEEALVRLAQTSLDPHLYLQDGTVLEWVPREEAARRLGRSGDGAAARSLQLTLLEPWESTRPGFLFFAFDDERVSVDGKEILVREGDGGRRLDVLHSVLAFTFETEEGLRELRVGLREGIWTEGTR